MNAWSEERRARAALTFICEPGKPDISALVRQQGAARVLDSLRNNPHETAWSRRAQAVDVDEIYLEAQRQGLRLVIPGDDEWPCRLDLLDHIDPVGDMAGSPLGLWVRGPASLKDLCGSQARPVAIVGARASTRYGEVTASVLAGDLAASCPVISGGAYGIDIAAHRGALEAGGPTIAVMAGGLDNWYPRGNSRILDQISDQYLVLSEVPAGIRPTRSGFLARNRLIAALGAGTVVVEAALRSGAVNTAHWTSALGRVLMAVPGPVDSAMSQTPHRLIRDHEAILVRDAQDVKAMVEPPDDDYEITLPGTPRELDDLQPGLKVVREALPARGDITVDELTLVSGRSPAECGAALVELQIMGLADQSGPGRWKLARKKSS